MASDYEKAVSEARSEQLAARAVARASTAQSLGRPRFALAAGVSLLLLTVVALGVTSASALPGDSLYGVSRAYEEVGGWVGVGDPVEQRLNEVIALADRGDGVLAVQAATEALEELGLTTNFVPDLTPTTTLPDPEDSGGGAVTQETTPATPSVSVEVSPEGVDQDSVQTLKLAAELLLNSVKNNGGELDAAAAGLAKAVDDLVAADDPVTAVGTSTTTTIPTTTTIVPDSTTTTVPEDTSTTTFPDSTTTTLPEDGEGEAGGGQGPIFLPPVP